MDAATFEHEVTVNRKAYEALRDQIRRDHRGHYVAIAQGQLVAACPDFDGALAAVRRLQPAPDFYLVFPADEEPVFEPFCDDEGRSYPVV